MILVPPIYIGSTIGVYLNKLLPDAINTGMLIVILCYCAYKSFTKYLKIYRDESAAKKEAETNLNQTKEPLVTEEHKSQLSDAPG